MWLFEDVEMSSARRSLANFLIGNWRNHSFVHKTFLLESKLFTFFRSRRSDIHIGRSCLAIKYIGRY